MLVFLECDQKLHLFNVPNASQGKKVNIFARTHPSSFNSYPGCGSELANTVTRPKYIWLSLFILLFWLWNTQFTRFKFGRVYYFF